jgi:DNA-binding CsgD family transcriptional regulator
MNEVANYRSFTGDPAYTYAATSVDAPALAAGVDAEQLSTLIAAIYDTTLDPERWWTVIHACRDFIGGSAASIFSKDVAGSGQVYYHDGGVDPHYVKLYFERYVRMDPSNVGQLFARIDQPISTADMHDTAEFEQSRFYREWVLPQGFVDFVISPIEKSSGWAALFGVFRHQRDGLADAATLERMRLIVPHIRRAVLIGRVIEEGRHQAASFGDALDGLAAGMFFLDQGGRLVHANRAGLAMLEARNVLHARDGRIASVDRAADRALAQVIGAARTGTLDGSPNGTSLTLEARDGTTFAAHLLPLASGDRAPGAGYAAVAALFVQRAALDTPSAPELIARRFALTPSELRVLVTIVQHGGVAETSEALGIGEATVKTHLHRIFGKTGAQRQADLVKLMAGHASPFATDAERRGGQPIDGRAPRTALAS